MIVRQRHSLRLMSAMLLSVAAATSLYPLLWLIHGALATPAGFSLLNLRHLLHERPVGTWLLNSIFLATTQTLLTVSVSALAGFALAKYRFGGRRVLMAVMLLTLLVPWQLLLPAEYELICRLGWIDTYTAVLLPGTASVFGALLFQRAMLGIPDDLLGAARLDGCNEFRVFWDVAVPTMRPVIGAFTLLTFCAAWNAFLWPQTVLQDERKYTLPIALANLTGLAGTGIPRGELLAANLLAILPVIVLVVAMQRDLIGGLGDVAHVGKREEK